MAILAILNHVSSLLIAKEESTCESEEGYIHIEPIKNLESLVNSSKEKTSCAIRLDKEAVITLEELPIERTCLLPIGMVIEFSECIDVAILEKDSLADVHSNSVSEALPVIQLFDSRHVLPPLHTSS